MSTTTARRSLADALVLAAEFGSLCCPPTGSSVAERWEFAGSLRRRRPDVGDIEHVVLPCFGQVRRPGSMWPEEGNLLWARLDDLLAAGTIERAVYGETGAHRWGDKYRGVLYRGVKHEIFTADHDNWGCILAIRTGPADYSARLVSRLKDHGVYRQQDGYVRYVAGPNAGAVRSCPTESDFLKLCGFPWLPPENRQ